MFDCKGITSRYRGVYAVQSASKKTMFRALNFHSQTTGQSVYIQSHAHTLQFTFIDSVYLLASQSTMACLDKVGIHHQNDDVWVDMV